MVKNRFYGVCAFKDVTGPIWMLTRTAAETAKASFVMALSIVAERRTARSKMQVNCNKLID